MYEHFAKVYEKLMGDVPYHHYVARLDEAIDYTGRPCKKIIDLGCGTGTMFPYLFERANQVIGIDPSSEMLSVASIHQIRYGQRLLLMESVASDIRVPLKADWCVAFTDVLNYVLQKEELWASFQAVSRALTDEGCFLFDLHSPKKFHEDLGDGQVYFEIQEDTVAIMKTSLDPENLLVQYDLTLFLKQPKSGLFEREDEVHLQKAYPMADVLEGLMNAGFTEVFVSVGERFLWEKKRAWSGNKTDQPLKVWLCHNENEISRAERWYFLAIKERSV